MEEKKPKKESSVLKGVLKFIKSFLILILIVILATVFIVYLCISAVVLAVSDKPIIRTSVSGISPMNSYNLFIDAADKKAVEEGIKSEVASVEDSLAKQLGEFKSKTDRDIFLYGSAIWTNPTETTVRKFMVPISVPIWKYEGSSKVEDFLTFEIHEKAKSDVEAIFEEIHNSPEKIVIDTEGANGFRWSPSYNGKYLMHPRGLAIDINVRDNWRLSPPPKVGEFWAPINVPKNQWEGTGYPAEGSEFSFAPDGVVVTIFKKWGWGWGGDWDEPDYMHFSIGYPKTGPW